MSGLIDKAKNTLKSDKSTPTVLVTGPSGYVGAWVAVKLLEKGYNVKGTVRSQAKADQFLKDHSTYASQLSFVIVEDGGKDNAYDEAVKDVEYIAHIASPFHMKSTDPSTHKELLYDPAINGTTNILKASLQHKGIKKIVITSSFASINDRDQGLRPGYNYTEKDWAPITWDQANTTTDPSFAYAASKKFAEVAAWDFVKEHNPHFKINTVHPPLIFGPIQHHIDKLDDLNQSVSNWYQVLKTKEIPATRVPLEVDVRDVADVHVALLFNDKAEGRYIAGGTKYTFDQAVKSISTSFPSEKLPKWDESRLSVDSYTLDAGKSERELGIKYIPLEKTIFDMTKQLFDFEDAGK